MNPNPELVAQNKQFEKQVLELAPNIFGAIGFAASNVYMIIGNDGLIIIDTTETTKAAQNILAEFRSITQGTYGENQKAVWYGAVIPG